MHVVISEKARIAFERMSRNEQRMARRAVEFLKVGNFAALHVKKFPKLKGVSIGKVDSSSRILFKKKSETEILVVDFIKPDEIKKFLGVR